VRCACSARLFYVASAALAAVLVLAALAPCFRPLRDGGLGSSRALIMRSSAPLHSDAIHLTVLPLVLIGLG